MTNLENEHQIRLAKGNKAGDGILSLGRRYSSLLNKMTENLDKPRSVALMDVHTGYDKFCRGGNTQTYLDSFLSKKQTGNPYQKNNRKGK